MDQVTKRRMREQPGELRRKWFAFLVQTALLLSLLIHGLGLFHKHDTAKDQDACVACQLTQHQAALDLADAGPGWLPALVLLFVVASSYRGVSIGAAVFARPRSRAPPFSLLS